MLTEGTLLRRLDDNRYETDFIILSKEMQLDNFAQMEKVAETFCPLLLELLDSAIDEIRAIGFHRCELPAEELYWLLLLMIVDTVTRWVKQRKNVPQKYTTRPHGGDWDIIGYESCELPFPTFVGLIGKGKPGAQFFTYKIHMNENMRDRAGELDEQEVLWVSFVLKKGRKRDAWTPPEHETFAKLVDRGFLRYEGNAPSPTFPVFDESDKKEIRQFYTIAKRILAGQMYGMIDALFDLYVDRIQSEVAARLHDQVKFVAGSLLSELRMMVLRHALAAKRIKLPDDATRSTLAMFMEI